MILRILTSLSLLIVFAFGCKKDDAAKPATQRSKVVASRPASAPAKAKTPAAAPQATRRAAPGRAHYLRACAPCHGLDGTGAQMRKMLPKIGNLTSASMHASLRDPEIVTLIKKGRGKMPPMENSLSEEHIQHIVAYIRTFRTN